MRLDRYLPEQRRLRADSGKQKLLVVGIVLAIHLVAGAGWVTWTTIRERNAPPIEVVTFFDIMPIPAVSAPAAATSTVPSASDEKADAAAKEPAKTAPPAPERR